MLRSSLLLAVVLVLSITLWADQSGNQPALAAAQLGSVHFPASCATSAQPHFTEGVALLHSFWYEEAEKSFQEAAKADPRCAIAHWGMAMSLWHQLWNRPDEATIERGKAEVTLARSLHGSKRERAYIAAAAAFFGGPSRRTFTTRATAYSHAMQRVYQRYPEDHEAAAFYALSLIRSDRKQAAAILEKLFVAEPNHPGVAHYLIHTYDTAETAELGLPAARRYAKIAPAAPHAVHMPSHIFARLGLWQEDIDSNLASIAASHRAEAMHLIDGGHQFHAMDFLVYAYLQSGRESDARKVIEEVQNMPPMKDMYDTGVDPAISDLVAFQASYALELHHWDEAANLPLVKGAELGDGSITHWARAIGAARDHKPAEARAETAEIEAIRQKLVEQKKPQFMVDAVEQDHQEALAWTEYAEGKDEEAATLLRSLTDKDSGVIDASDEIPIREMLADMLLEMNRPQQAFVEYQADLKANPNRFDGLYGAARAAEMAGKQDLANGYYAQLVKQCEGAASARPELKQARAALHQEAGRFTPRAVELYRSSPTGSKKV